MWLPLFTALALTLPSPLQDSKPPAEKPAEATSVVRVPSYPNVSCPIMGKPISSRLFTDTKYGRLWICCKSCIEDIRADVETAYRAAYPTTKKIVNELSPVSGKKIEEESPRLELQGYDFAVFDAAELEQAQAHAQVVLAKLHEPALVDLSNKTCPVTGEPTVPNAFVVIEGTIVRLSSPKLLEEIEKDPAKVLAKARKIHAEEQAAPQDGGSGK